MKSLPVIAVFLILGASLLNGASPVLKFRILLEEPPLRNASEEGSLDVRILNDDTAGSASAKVDESSATIDQIRQTLSLSDYIRIVDSDGDPSQVDFILKYRVDYEPAEPKVFMTLFDSENKAAVYSMAASGKTTSLAVGKLLGELERSLLERDWTVRVKAIANGRLLLPRGENDGLRPGTELSGYPGSGEPEGFTADEQLLMAGDSAASYVVVRIRDEAALVEPVGEAPLLEPGDLLEYRGVDLRDREDPNRDRDTWDRLYDNQTN